MRAGKLGLGISGGNIHPLSQVSVSPAAPSVVAYASQTFTAIGGDGGPYTWALTASPSGGSINANSGVYTAGANGGTDVVQATDGLGHTGTTNVTAVAFTPTQIAGLVSWHRADLGITLNGATVASWADQSGNGHTITQATALVQPGYTASNAGYNNKPTVDFTGTQWIDSPTSFNIPQPITAIVVGQYSGAGTQQLTGAAKVGGHRSELYTSTNQLHLYSAPNDIADGNKQAAKHVFAGVYNGASSAIYVDNSQAAAATGTASDSWDAIELGATQRGAGNFLIGSEAEVIVYGTAVSATDLLHLFAYLGARYTITVS